MTQRRTERLFEVGPVSTQGYAPRPCEQNQNQRPCRHPQYQYRVCGWTGTTGSRIHGYISLKFLPGGNVAVVVKITPPNVAGAFDFQHGVTWRHARQNFKRRTGRRQGQTKSTSVTLERFRPLKEKTSMLSKGARQATGSTAAVFFLPTSRRALSYLRHRSVRDSEMKDESGFGDLESRRC